MTEDETIKALEAVRTASAEWRTARKEFDHQVSRVMWRLLHEAARAMIPLEDVAKHSGMSKGRIRRLMKHAGIDYRRGRTILSRQSANVLKSNAALIGVRPDEMDLNSLLAYLPAGDLFRETRSPISVVTELPEEDGEA